MKNILIINGSHRKDGSTQILKDKFVETIKKEKFNIKELNLAEMNIEYFDYNSKYTDKDEYPTIQKELLKADTIIIATPVYWYSMPAKLKTVFDRFNDMYREGKTKELEGKNVILMYTHGSDIGKPEFAFPIKDTSDYLKMNYLGSFSIRTKFPKGIYNEEDEKKINRFANEILKKII